MCTLNVGINGGGEKEMFAGQFAGQQFKPKKKKSSLFQGTSYSYSLTSSWRLEHDLEE